ncbi:uncharacterized protein N7506_003037 [Penicillium brevicompactum]|uniref:uncharacterized protein n=1 Tax=Penicillium brevicompactum TaxID=5074 RepID=UPI0025410D86|nr:uncharacterized protein N7506_003037 [Penicillium brevicompactum]KAJ5343213.1 hypothetical protein N7506_003037 [Penicillium brevicompactum]
MLGDFFRNLAEIVINSERAFLCTLLVCCGCFLLFRVNILFKWTPRARSLERGQQSEAKETVESLPPQDQSAVEEVQDLSETKSQTSIHPPRAGYPIQILHEENDATVEYGKFIDLPSLL